MEFGCAATGWSAVTSAGANATLAGVLAGFMLNGIVLLLSGKPPDGRRTGYVQAASLLFTAFVVLGLDSYLFGLITGDNTTGPACRQAWTEAMLAAGLLGLGAVAVVVGFVFLFGVFFAAPDTTDDQAKDQAADHAGKAMTESMKMLEALCDLLRPGVAAAVILLLYMTARSYLSAIFNGQVPSWGHILLVAVLIFDYCAVSLFIVVYFWGSSRNPIGSNAEQEPRTERFVSISSVNWILNYIWRLLHPDLVDQVKTLKLTIFLSVGYTLATVIGASFLVITTPPFWAPGRPLATVLIFATILWVLVVSLIPLAALLAPSFGPRSERAARAGRSPARPAHE